MQGSNQFTDIGVCAIAEGLKNNSSVTKIDLVIDHVFLVFILSGRFVLT